MELPDAQGGLSLPRALRFWSSRHLAGAAACLAYLSVHRDAYCLDAASLDPASTLVRLR